jgi:hypothetical protein
MTTPDVPEEAQDQLRKAVDTALNKPLQAQGFLSSIPDLTSVGDIKHKAVEVLDDVLGAINTLQQYQWLIPAKYRDPIQKLEDALNKVKSWLD